MAEVPLERIEPDGRLQALYNRAGDFELELERVVGRDRNALLTDEQVNRFNELLKAALELLPNSVALKQDIEEIEGTINALDAHHDLHITVVPTLHNALPTALAAQ